jgi:hypothetical protein
MCKTALARPSAEFSQVAVYGGTISGFSGVGKILWSYEFATKTVRRWLGTVRRWLGKEPVPVDDQVWLRRHQRLCTAIEFPADLVWIEDGQELTPESEKKLYDFAEDLANSAIDWYGTEKEAKRFYSKLLRNFSYFFVIAGAVVPIANILGFEIARAWFPGAEHLSEIWAEVSLVLLAIAGGLHLIDNLTGSSAAWMRYSSTEMGIQQNLQNFRFEWNAAKGGYRLPAKRPESAGNLVLSRLQRVDQSGEQTPKLLSRGETLLALAWEFCNAVVEAVTNESEKWAQEFSDSLQQFERHLSSDTLRRSSRTP